MVRSTATTMERRMDALERRMNEFRVELHNQRDDFREWMKRAELRLQKKRRRRRGRSRPHEESGETVEPATVHIAMRKSEEVEEKMKNLGNLNGIAADADVGNLHSRPPEPPEPPDSDLLTVVAWPSYKLGEAFLSLVTGEGYRGDEEPKWDSGDDEPKWDSGDEEPKWDSEDEEPSLEEEWQNDTTTMKEVWLTCNGGEPHLEAMFSDREWRKKIWPESTPEEEKRSGGDGNAAETAWVEENEAVAVEEELLARDLGSSFLSLEAAEERRMKVRDDPVVSTLGQAQFLVSDIDPCYIERGVLKEKKDLDKDNVVGSSWTLKKVDLTFNPMGQAHSFIITPTIFINQEGMVQEEWEVKNGMSLFLKNPQYWGTYLMDNGEGKEVGVGRNYCNGFQLISIVIVGVVRSCSQTITIMVKLLFVYWDPGGLKRDGWDLGVLKRDERLQESDSTSDVQDMKILDHLIGLLWEGKVRKWIVCKWVRRFSTEDSFFIFNWGSLIVVQRKDFKAK